MEENEYIEGLILKYLNQEASPVEEAELQQWLDADPGHRQEYQALEKIWRVSGPALHYRVFDKGAAWEKMRPRVLYSPKEISMPVRGRQLFTLRRGIAAAAVLLIVASAGWWYSTRNRGGAS